MQPKDHVTSVCYWTFTFVVVMWLWYYFLAEEHGEHGARYFRMVFLISLAVAVSGAPHIHLSYGDKAHKERCQRNGSGNVGAGTVIQGLFRLRGGVTPDTLMNRSSVTPAQASHLKHVSNVIRATTSGWCCSSLYDKKLARFFEKGEILVTNENIEDWMCDVPDQTMGYIWEIEHNRRLMRHMEKGTPMKVFRVKPGVDIEAVIETAGLQFHQSDTPPNTDPSPDMVGPSIAEKNEIEVINNVMDELLRRVSNTDVSEDIKERLNASVQNMISDVIKKTKRSNKKTVKLGAV